MSSISQQKIAKIKEDILQVIFENSPKSLYTYQIAEKIARDDEFVKRLLLDLSKEGVVELINNNLTFKSWKKWRLTNNAYAEYQKLYEFKNK